MKRYLLAFTLFIASLSVGFGQGEFITEWFDFHGGVIRFYIGGNGPVNYNWTTVGGGAVITGNGVATPNADVIIGSLPVNRVVQISLSPQNLTHVNFGYQDRFVLAEVIQWGTTSWTDMSDAFSGCANVNINIATDVPDLGGVSSTAAMFNGCIRMTSGVTLWNVSNVVNMGLMFRGATNFNDDISQWDVSSVSNMNEMFSDSENFNSNLSQWDVSSLVFADDMFRNAKVFNSDLSSWNVSNLVRMFGMFSGAENFNSDISQWDVSSVNSMSFMFANATNFNSDLSQWNVSSVNNMGRMFSGADNFNSDLSQWDVSSVSEMAFMFFNASNFNANLQNWDLSNIGSIFSIHNITNMFSNSGLSCENYSNFLDGQANNPNVPSGLSLGASSLQYGNDAVAARNTLINTKGWTITGDSPSGFDCLNVPLPVELLNFTATNTDQGHHVAWTTASELNNSHFVLEHSINGSEDSFQELTIVEGKGTTSELSAYRYVNKTNVAGTHYYRLKQVDFDGTSSFSDVVALTQGEATEISIYPNPADQSLTLSGILAGEQVMLTDALGRIVFQGAYNGDQLAIGHLPAGTYMLQGGQAGRGFTRRFVKL